LPSVQEIVSTELLISVAGVGPLCVQAEPKATVPVMSKKAKADRAIMANPLYFPIIA